MKELKLSNFRLINQALTKIQTDFTRTGLILITGGPSAGKTRFA